MSNDPTADPFGEHLPHQYRMRCYTLGARCDFRSNSKALVALAESAFAQLPRYRMFADTPRFTVTLRLAPGATSASSAAPLPLRTYAAEGLVCGSIDSANHVVVSPAQRSALVVISRDMLRFPYHARYELIEFAVYVLATRALRLLPLHAACVGRNGDGLLLVGDSGAGKSTLAVHAMLHGLTLLAEDSVFIRPAEWLACAAPNFMHLRTDSLRSLDDRALAGRLRRAPIIRRRSGVEKYEVDLRNGNWPTARHALRIAHIVFLSQTRGTVGQLLKPLPRRRLKPMLLATQPYAASLQGWAAFCQRAVASQAYVLMRGQSPAASINALKTLL
jgi:hypothetical protein